MEVGRSFWAANGRQKEIFLSKQVTNRAARRRQTQNPAQIVAEPRIKPRTKPRVISREPHAKIEATVDKMGTTHKKSPQPRTNNRRVAHLRCPPISCQYRCLMVIDRFSLDLEPWPGVGFDLAALVPPNGWLFVPLRGLPVYGRILSNIEKVGIIWVRG